MEKRGVPAFSAEFRFGCHDSLAHVAHATRRLRDSLAKFDSIFEITEILLIRITVMEKTQMDHTVSKKMHNLELAASSPQPTL